MHRPKRLLAASVTLCLLSGCALFGDDGSSEIGRKYVVFFTKGSSSLDGPGATVVSHAAIVAGRHPELSLVVEGYAAANGSIDADAALSATRASVVARALRADGVADARISEHARPPANEDPGVAARRVEIVFPSP